MENKVILNYRLMDYIANSVKSMINNLVENEPKKMKAFIAVNNMLNELGSKITDNKIPEIVSEELLNKVFEEIKYDM